MNRLVLVRILVLLIIVTYLGLASRIDSLENLLNHADLKSKVHILNDLSIEYYDVNPEKFLELTNQSLKENEKINDKLEKFISLTNLAFYYNQVDSIKEKSYYEKAYLLIPEIEDTEKSAAYQYLVRNFERKKLIDSVYNYSYLAYKYSEFEKDVILNLKIRDSYSSALRNRGNYKDAIKIAEEMIALAKKNNLSEWIAQSNAVMGLVLRDWKKYDMAIEKFSDAILQLKEFLSTTKLTQTQMKTYNRFMFSYYNNLAIIFSEIKKFDEAVKHLQSARYYSQKLDDVETIAQVNTNLGFIFYQGEKFDSAIVYFGLGARQAVEIKAFDGAIINFTNLSSSYSKLNNHTEALKYAKISYDYYSKNNFGYLINAVYMNLIEAFKNNKDFESALKFQTEYYEKKDSMSNKEVDLKIADIYSNFELQNTKKEKELLQKEQKNNLIIFVLIILIAIIVLISNYFRLKAKNKLNTILSEKNEEINSKNEELQKVIATKDKFFSIIAHDIRNPLASFMQLTEMMHNSYDSFENELKKDYIGMMKQTANNLFSLLVNLLDWSKTQRGLIEVNYEEFELKFAVDSVLRNLQTSANSKNINIKKNFSDDIKLFADINLISTVLRNLISNAIKFTKIDGQIEIFAEKDENLSQIKIGIKDNGVGIKPENLDKLFNVGESRSTLGTNKEEGTGLGLILCKEFVELHRGTIWVESELNVGTTFYFTIPGKE